MANEFNSHEELMRQDLVEDFKNLDNKNKELETNRIISTNRLKKLKVGILKEMFDSLRDMGVDPNDVNSIGRFLDRLRSQDPDLAELFEFAFNNLVSGLDNNPIGNALGAAGEAEGAISEVPPLQGVSGATEPPVPESGGMGTDVDKFSGLAGMMK